MEGEGKRKGRQGEKGKLEVKKKRRKGRRREKGRMKGQ